MSEPKNTSLPKGYFDTQVPRGNSTPLANKIKELLELLAPKDVHTLSYFGNSMSTSIVFKNRTNLGPVYYRSLMKLSPDQKRIQWNIASSGYRIDSTSAVGFELEQFSIEVAQRKTYASGPIAAVENQKIGYFTLRVCRIRFQYYNDHYFVFFPMGGGTDQGDTAGFNVYYFPQNEYRIFNFRLGMIGAGLKLSTGIPNQTKKAQIGERLIYPDVEFNQVSTNILYGSARFEHSSRIKVELQLGIDSGAIGETFQNRLVHRNLGIPEFVKPNYIKPYFGLGISIPFDM